ncbi:MAG: DUF4236 domain-containing protein [Phycisphaeraceae bacterium]
MAFRFFRRVRLAPGLSLNLSKRGGSLSFGPRGAKVTAGTSGVRRTVSLPGTGLWYTEKVGGGKRRSTPRRRGSASPSSNGTLPPAPTVRAQDRLTLGFFKRLVTPKGEEHFVDGMRHVVLGEDGKALTHLRQAVHLADAAFMAGMLALKAERYDEAVQYFGYARQKHSGLGRYFAKYDIDAAVSLPITKRIRAQVGPSIRGITLALAEAHQALGDWKQAIRDLHQLHQRDPADMVVTLSLCEILVEELGDKRAMQQVVKLSKNISNESELHAAVLLWKGKALRLLGLHTAARDTLTTALRRTKDRSDELLQALRYERAMVYEALGKASRTRQELEKLYADAPDYEDVAERLGMAKA